ncbi:MAG: twin-arginine translocase TatA/TatE family subunit [Saprospiraceae bacterium]|nr:twin-arginine translocase TatA/TatE family subunit [Saprospiraceae bacterium]
MELISIFLLMGLSPGELIVIGVVLIILFGAKIPELARGLGRGIREFKDATKEIKHNIEESAKIEEDKTTSSK